MKKVKYFILGIFLVGGITAGMNAQVNVYMDEDLDEAFFAEIKLTTEQVSQIQETLTQKLSEYSKYGKLVNPSSQTIDRTSVGSFKNLFSLGAQVFNDLREIPESFPIPLEGYIEFGRAYFTPDGLKFGLNSAKIIKIDYFGANDRYNIVVAVSKTVERYYTADGDIQVGEQSYDLEFIYTLKLNDLNNAKITGIRGQTGKTPDTYTNIYGITGGIGFGNIGFSESSYFQEVRNTGTIEVNAGLEYSIGADLHTNFFNNKKSPNKALFLSAGGAVFLQKITGKLNDYSTADVEPINGEIPSSSESVVIIEGVNRRAFNVNVEETQNLIGARGLIGVSYRLLNTNTASAFLTVQYAPSLIVSARGELSGTGDYELDISEIGFNTASLNAYSNGLFASVYEIGEDKLIQSKPELSTSISHGVLLSGTFLKDLIDDNPTYGIALKLQYYLPLTNLWSFEKSTVKPFLYPDRNDHIQPGVLTPFADEARYSHFGLSLSVYFKKSKQP